MKDQLSNAKTSENGWRLLYKVGGAAALIVLLLFLIGTISIITIGLQSTITNDWFMQLQNNWLVVLFKMSAGVNGQLVLSVLNPLDIVIMALFCTVSLALYVALKPTSKIWSLIAAILPFLGIPLFLITNIIGRSNLLIGGLLFSAVMLRSKIFSKVTAYVGIVASVLLFFVGDLATAAFSSSSIIAVLIGVGYVLWMAWFFLIARRLYQVRDAVSKHLNR